MAWAASGAPMPKASLPKAPRILLLRTSSLGDVCHALPAVWSLHQQCPEAHLSWLINRSLVPVIELLAPAEAIPFDREALRGSGAISRLWESIEPLLQRRGSFDLALDFQGLLRSALLALASGAPERLGPAGAREGTLLYTRRVRSLPGLRHAIDEARSFLPALGLSPELAAGASLPLPPARRKALRESCASFGLPQGMLAVIPGARWDSKRWPVESWIELIRLLDSDRVLLLGSAADAKLTGRIAQATGALDLAGRTSLRQLAGLLQGAALAVGGDSGALHLAVALGRPVVGIYGPTNWPRTRPYGAANQLLIRSELGCLRCRYRRCPLPDHPCMKLGSEEVAAAIARVLKKSIPSGSM